MMADKPVLKLLLHCQVGKETALGGRPKTSRETSQDDMHAEFIRDLSVSVDLVIKGLS